MPGHDAGVCKRAATKALECVLSFERAWRAVKALFFCSRQWRGGAEHLEHAAAPERNFEVAGTQPRKGDAAGDRIAPPKLGSQCGRNRGQLAWHDPIVSGAHCQWPVNPADLKNPPARLAWGRGVGAHNPPSHLAVRVATRPNIGITGQVSPALDRSPGRSRAETREKSHEGPTERRHAGRNEKPAERRRAGRTSSRGPQNTYSMRSTPIVRNASCARRRCAIERSSKQTITE